MLSSLSSGLAVAVLRVDGGLDTSAVFVSNANANNHHDVDEDDSDEDIEGVEENTKVIFIDNQGREKMPFLVF